LKLTSKDAAFLEALRTLLQEEQLRIELKEDGLKRLVLRQNYGTAISRHFKMTRQGVRWRFNHITEIYVSAYLTILTIESLFGTELRHHAMAIAKQRAELRQRAQKLGKLTLPRRKASLRPASAR